MPDIELLKRPSREGGESFQDQGELQRVYSCSRSCEINTSAPCVRKAVYHIQELKNKLENWCQQETNKRHNHSEGRNQSGSIWRFDSVDSACLGTPAELYIEGMGLCLQSNYENSALAQIWKGMDGVLLEIMSLIESLESDRQEAKEALNKEQLKAETLRRKRDSLSLWKQQQFPAAVQIEYEACLRDVTELKWHLKVKSDQMQSMRKSLSHTEAQNCRLVEHIDFVRKYGPLVKEKLQLESEIIKQIKSAQTEAFETFTKLSHELSSFHQELESQELLANKERNVMTMELKDVRTHLKDRISDLQQLKSYWDFYCTKVHETEKNVALKDKQLDSMLLQIPLIETQEAKINDIVLELRGKLQDQDREMQEKQNEAIHRQKQIQTTRHEGETKLSECEEVFNRKRQELLHLQDENKEQEIEIEDLNKKIHQSKQAVKHLQRDCKGILEKINQNDEEREQVKGEVTLEAAQHADTRARLEDLARQTFTQEQRMRKETEKWKVQLMSEMNLIAALKGEISSIMEEYNLLKAECETVKNELMIEYEDAHSTAAQLETEMVKLKDMHTVKSKNITNLKGKLSDIVTEHKSLSDDLEEKKSTCLNHLNSVKKIHSEVSARCEQASCRTEELRLMSEEYRKSSHMMEQVTANMPQIIDKLQSMSDLVKYKHNAAAVVMNSLQNHMVACRSRTSLSEKNHSTLLAQRQAIMLEIKTNLKTALTENMEMAQEYRVLQKSLLMARREAVCVFNKKNKAESSFHDHKQLSLLQRRMHKAMLKYFKHRSVYSQAELAHFQALSNQNNQKMKALQEELSRAIRHISAFLHSLIDNPTTGHDAAVAAAADKQRREDSDGLNRAMPTVQIAE